MAAVGAKLSKGSKEVMPAAYEIEPKGRNIKTKIRSSQDLILNHR